MVSLKYFWSLSRDKGGEKLVATLAGSTLRDRVRCISFDEAKDISELYQSDPSTFQGRLRHYHDQAVPIDIYAALREQTQVSADEAECQFLSDKKDILDALEEAVTATGFVGEGRAIRLIFLALVTRRCMR